MSYCLLQSCPEYTDPTVAETTASTVETATTEIAELKKENKDLKENMHRMEGVMQSQGRALRKVTLSDLDSKRRRYRK